MVDPRRVRQLLDRIAEEQGHLRRLATLVSPRCSRFSAKPAFLAEDLAEAMEQAARFRNLLVHQYATVDDRRVVDLLSTRLADLTGSVARSLRR